MDPRTRRRQKRRRAKKLEVWRRKHRGRQMLRSLADNQDGLNKLAACMGEFIHTQLARAHIPKEQWARPHGETHD